MSVMRHQSAMRSYFTRRRMAVMTVVFIVLLVLLFSSNPTEEYHHVTPLRALSVPPLTADELPKFSGSGYTCMHPSDGAKYASTMRYAVIIDAGSTGTRVHVYSLVYCDSQVVSLHNEIFHEVPKGLSSFASNPQDIDAQVLQPLLQLGLEHVPPSQYAVTPLALKATAGLRLLPASSVEAILRAVKTSFSSTPFHVANDAVSVISGEEEGVWGWITVNFLLNKIGFLREQSSSSAVSTAAIMDLGGASTQLVFELDEADRALYAHHTEAACQDNTELCSLLRQTIQTLQFGDQSFTLFQKSFLGYGLMEARKKIKATELVESDNTKSERSFSCFPAAHAEPLMVHDKTVWLNGTLVSDATQCYRHVKSAFPLNTACALPPCTLSGTPLPSSLSHLTSIYAFSYFYDRLQSFFPGSLEIPLSKIPEHAQSICTSHHDTSNPNLCLDVMYIRTLLLDAYNLPADRHIHLSKKINGVETCWALGAALHLLSA